MSKVLLDSLRDLLSENTWCKKHFAIDKLGNDISFTSPEACKFCLTGARMRVAFSLDVLPEVRQMFGRDLILVIREQYPTRSNQPCPIEHFNDHPDTTFSDVQRVLERLGEIYAQ